MTSIPNNPLLPTTGSTADPAPASPTTAVPAAKSTTTPAVHSELTTGEPAAHGISAPAPAGSPLLAGLATPKTTKTNQPTEPTLAQRGARVWRRFRGADRTEHQAASAQAFGLQPRNWYIYRTPAMSSYAPIYGMIEASAERHGLRPEFLHAVIMGEGLGHFIDEQRQLKNRYDPNIEIDGYDFLGTDEIGDPAHLQALIDEGDLDPSVAARVTPFSVVNELGEDKTSARVRGYEAAVELVAAELHRRRDQILDYAAQQGADLSTFPTMPGYPTFAVEYLTYAQYNNPSVARDAVRRPQVYMRPWTGPERSDERNVRYNTMVRLATADWYRRAGVYNAP